MESVAEKRYLNVLEQVLNSYFRYHDYAIGKEEYDNLCLIKENGCWIVFYNEIGRHDLVSFDSVEDASSYLMKKLFKKNKTELAEAQQKLKAAI